MQPRPERRGSLYVARPLSALAASFLTVVAGVTPLPEPPPVAAWGPAGGEQGLVFTATGMGFLASGPGAYTAGGAAGPAEIQRTTDDGLRWSTVWRGSGYRLTWTGVAGNSVVAAGLRGSANRPLPFLLDGGPTGAAWRLTKVSVSPPALAAAWGGYQFHFVNRLLGFAAPDPMTGEASSVPAALLRTTDGGSHWAPVSLPGGTPTGGLAFVSPRRGFATGAVKAPGPSGRCLARIWATADGGARWRPLPGTCTSYRLTSLSFPAPGTGFAAGGQYLKYSATGQELFVLGTTDGGQHWSAIYDATVGGATALDANPFGAVAFFNPRVGLALDGGQTAGGNGPVGGHVWRTSDGGRKWYQLPEKGLRLVLDGPDGAWLVGGEVGNGGNVLWRSLDQGLDWQPVGNPGRATVTALAGYGNQLWVSTEAGDFVSTDGGRTWHRPPPAMEAAESSTWAGTPVQFGAHGTVVIGPGWSGDDAYWLSGDGGRTGRARRLPGLASTGVAAIAFSDHEHGLAAGLGANGASPVMATADGGATWQAAGSIDLDVDSLAYDGHLAVAAGSYGAAGAVFISTSSGRTWSGYTTGDLCGPVSLRGRTVAVLCTRSQTGDQYLLLSLDGGGHWATVARGPASAVGAPGAAAAAATGPSSVVVTGPATIWAGGPAGMAWRSTDAGRHWQARPLLLPLLP